MGLLVVLLACIALCTGNMFFLVPGDNSHYVEGDSRYIWMPDGEGVPHLVDLEAADEDEPETARSGADNQYWLYTRLNHYNAQILVHYNVNTVRASHYNGTAPTVVIVHGWKGSPTSPMNPLIRDALLAVGDFNVIVVDWERVADRLYVTAMKDVPNVGVYLGSFLTWLLDTAGGSWNDLHLVGFSLGAHVVGNAGRTASGRPGRVTGLDPAGPLWSGNSNALNINSGVHVESIHTDGGILGILDPISHADFYPNGGRNPQPGCWVSTCSHSRAPELFASSVRTNHFVGYQCANLIEAAFTNCHGGTLRMGNAVIRKQGSGLYGLFTDSSWPF